MFFYLNTFVHFSVLPKQPGGVARIVKIHFPEPTTQPAASMAAATTPTKKKKPPREGCGETYDGNGASAAIK
jgi:hypothetical protein